jgi:hypothetical protein
MGQHGVYRVYRTLTILPAPCTEEFPTEGPQQWAHVGISLESAHCHAAGWSLTSVDESLKSSGLHRDRVVQGVLETFTEGGRGFQAHAALFSTTPAR